MDNRARLLQIADEAYGDGLIGKAVDPATGELNAVGSCLHCRDVGDSLALFVARELNDCFVAEVDPADPVWSQQCDEAIMALVRAQDDLQRVIDALSAH